MNKILQASAGLGNVTVGDALTTGVKNEVFAPSGGIGNMLIKGIAGYLVGRAFGSPWTVALSSAVFDYGGLLVSTAIVARNKGGSR